MTNEQLRQHYEDSNSDDLHDPNKISLESKLDAIEKKATQELEDLRSKLHSRANKRFQLLEEFLPLETEDIHASWGERSNRLTRRDPPIPAMTNSNATKVRSNAIPEMLSAISEEAGRNVDARRILNSLSDGFFDREFCFERKGYDIYIETFLTREELAVQGIRSEADAKLTFKATIDSVRTNITLYLALTREVRLEIEKGTKLYNYVYWLARRYYNWSESGVTDFENYLEDRASFATEQKNEAKIAKKEAEKENVATIAMVGTILSALSAVVFCGIKWGLIAGFGAAFGILLLLLMIGCNS